MALYKKIVDQVNQMDQSGYSTRDIAMILDTSERTVRRARQWFRENLSTASDIDVQALLGSPIDDSESTVADSETEQEDVKYTVMASESSITISRGDESETITRSDQDFEKISDIVWESRASQEALKEAFEMMSYTEEFIKMTDGMVAVDSSKGVVLFDGCQISPALANRIIDCCKEGDREALTGLVEFTKKLHENPSRRAVMELYSFLKASDILIREDGMVECYKRVRDDYMDFYTGSTRNKPGDEPQMHRWEVDEDKHQTCSAGYHVCAKSYLPSYHEGHGRVVKCLVHPADFVSIPIDYNFAKARVWRYKVLSEVTDF